MFADRGIAVDAGREIDTLVLLVGLSRGNIMPADGLLRAILSANQGMINYLYKSPELSTVADDIMLIGYTFRNDLENVKFYHDRVEAQSRAVTAAMVFSIFEGYEDVADFLRNSELADLSSAGDEPLYMIAEMGSLDLFKYVFYNSHRFYGVTLDDIIQGSIVDSSNIIFTEEVVKIAHNINYIPKCTLIRLLFRDNPAILDIIITPSNFDIVLFDCIGEDIATAELLLKTYSQYLGIGGRLYPAIEDIMRKYLPTSSFDVFLNRALILVNAMEHSRDPATSRLARYIKGIELDSRAEEKIKYMMYNEEEIVTLTLLVVFNNYQGVTRVAPSMYKFHKISAVETLTPAMNVAEKLGYYDISTYLLLFIAQLSA